MDCVGNEHEFYVLVAPELQQARVREDAEHLRLRFACFVNEKNSPNIEGYSDYGLNYRLKHGHTSGIILKVYENIEQKQTKEYSISFKIKDLFSK